MSISIRNLYQDVRDVGKTIKATKKYFLWEFALNGKYHKVEIFHSKVSGKKKLCVDAQTVVEQKSYKNDFTYSFKIDKNYFNCVQSGNDKYELRIDNKLFELLIQEERTGRMVGEKSETAINKKNSSAEIEEQSNKFRGSSFTGASSAVSSSNPRNNGGGDFFNDNDFDFGVGSGVNNSSNRNKSVITVPSINTFSNFNEFSNKFSNSSSNEVKPPKSNQVLVDVNDIFTEKRNQSVTESKNILSQINFDDVNENSNVNNFDNFKNNNEKIVKKNSVNNVSNVNNVNNENIFQHNQNLLNTFSIPGITDDSDSYTNSNNSNSNSNTGNNFGLNKRISEFRIDNNSPISFNDSGSNMTNVGFNNTSNQVDSSKNENINDFKKNIITSGLVDLNNILDNTKKSNTATNSNSNYNLGFNTGGTLLNYNFINTDMQGMNMNNGNNRGSISVNNAQTNYTNNPQMNYTNNPQMNYTNNPQMNYTNNPQANYGGYSMPNAMSMNTGYNMPMSMPMNTGNIGPSKQNSLNLNNQRKSTPFDF